VQGASAIALLLGVLFAAPVAILILAWTWLLPVVEIAPKGQSRFERFRNAVIAIVLGLVATGIGKRLFG